VPLDGTLTIFAGNLGPGDNFTFNGALETDGKFMVYCGEGTDLVTTGAGDDGIYFGPDKFDPLVDRVDGGGGSNDQLALDGDYLGLTLDGTAIQNIEAIVLLAGVPSDLAEYDLVLANSLTAAGQTMIVWGCPVETAITVNGSAEADATSVLRMYGGTVGDTLTGGAGADWFWGGLGGDTLTGNAGADTFFYETVDQSSAAAYDTLVAFDDTTDKIDLDGLTVSGFAGPLSGSLSTGTLGTQLEAAAGSLGAGQALVFTANAGTLNGSVFLLIDGNGTAGYQASGDFLIELASPVGTVDNLGMFI
jgi:Ca2+-binding RTX toxin-like protein